MPGRGRPGAPGRGGLPPRVAELKRLPPDESTAVLQQEDVPGAELAMALNTFFRFVSTDLALVYGGGESGLSYFLKTVGRRIAQDAKAEIQPLEDEFIDRALADAWRRAGTKYRPDPGQWPGNARRAVTGRRLGYFESLDGFPSLDPAHDLNFPALRCVDVGTVLSQSGQTYSQWVPLADVDTALSILPIGPSERLDSPMRTVNYEGWVKDKLHPAPLSRAAVEKYPWNKAVLSR